MSLLYLPIYRILRSMSQMALDMEKEIARHQKGWADFAKWTFVSTVIIIAIVGMMALTLV